MTSGFMACNPYTAPSAQILSWLHWLRLWSKAGQPHHFLCKEIMLLKSQKIVYIDWNITVLTRIVAFLHLSLLEKADLGINL